MNTKNPYTKIEVIEERHPKQPEDSPLVKVSHVLVNGAPVRIAKDGIFIDYGHDEGDGQNVVRVSLEFLVDEFHIHQVPHGYTDGISEWEVELLAAQQREVDQVVEHFDDGHIRFKTKPEQPRDHLGRFTKRKSHYSDYLTDD